MAKQIPDYEVARHVDEAKRIERARQDARADALREALDWKTKFQEREAYVEELRTQNKEAWTEHFWPVQQDLEATRERLSQVESERDGLRAELEAVKAERDEAITALRGVDAIAEQLARGAKGA
jgi:chromosome segregation ATPase